MMHHASLGNKEEVFSYKNEDEPEVHIAVGRLNSWLTEKNFPMRYMDIDPGFAEHCLTHRGIEQPRLDRLTMDAMFRPITTVQWYEDRPSDVLVIDGHHRYVWAYQNGLKKILQWAVPWQYWQDYRINGLPDLGHEGLRNMHSGL